MKVGGLSSFAVVCLTTLSAAALSPIPADHALIHKRDPAEAELDGTLFERGYHHGHHHARHPARHGHSHGDKRQNGRFGNGRNRGGNNGGGTQSTSSAAAAASSAAAGGTGNGNGGGGALVDASDTGDEQTSRILSADQVQQGFALDGQQVPADGQVASATSVNNFINFCATRDDLPLTNGAQVKTGSCNAAPMGVIAATTNMPASKFVNPPNLGDLTANQDFDIQMAVQKLQTGNFVNAASNYYSAPQNTNGQGDIIGHSHFVIQEIPSITSTEILDPAVFAFFKGVNKAAQGRILTETVAGGLPDGNYKLSSINSAANHQPVLVAVAQHGSLDDAVYFTVGQGQGAAAGGNGAQAGGGTAASSSAAAATSSAAATGNNNGGGNGNGRNGNGRGRFGNGRNNNKRAQSPPILRESLLRKRLAALEAQAARA